MDIGENSSPAPEDIWVSSDEILDILMLYGLEDVNEVKNGNECGMGIKNYKDIKPGDKIEVFDRKEEAQQI